jgi:hypothetical protein
MASPWLEVTKVSCCHSTVLGRVLTTLQVIPASKLLRRAFRRTSTKVLGEGVATTATKLSGMGAAAGTKVVPPSLERYTPA